MLFRSGQNIAQYLVGDLIEGRDMPPAITSSRSIWRMIPRRLAYRYIPRR